MAYAYFTDFINSVTKVRYNYVFTDKDMFHARLHARDVAQQIDAWPTMVRRIDKRTYNIFKDQYATPTPYSWPVEEDENV